ncbi:MAG: TadG family pilus assembly protein [Asticcacaulis sp.]
MSGLFNWPAHFLKDRRGGVMIITSVTMTLVIALAALAIDMGHVFLQSRKLQGIADLAALSAASDLPQAQAAALATVQANHWPEAAGPLSITTQTGHYEASRGQGGHEGFIASSGHMTANAARVTLRGETPLFFGQLLLNRKSVTIERTALATQTRLAAFSIGTGLLDLNGGVVNGLLSGLTGSSLSLSVMDYNALAGAEVDLLSYVEALHTELDLTAADYNDVLKSEITMGKALSILADQVSVNARGPIRAIAATNIRDTRIKLNELIDIGAYGYQDSVSDASDAAVRVGSDDVLNAMLALANKNRQVELDLGASLPGLASVKTYLAIGERPNNSPWITITNEGAPILRTAQTRLYIEASTKEAGGLNGLNNLLGGLISGLLGVPKPKVDLITLPILVEVASAEARLSKIGCAPSPSNRSVTLDLKPSIGRVMIGKVNVNDLKDFKKDLTVAPAALVNLAGIMVTAKSEIRLGGESWQKLTFSAADIANRKTKTAKTNDALTSVASSLVHRMSLTVAGIDLGAVTSVLGGVLGTLATVLDPLLNQLLGLLGIGLGTVDAQVNGVRCTGAVLVA